LNSQHGQLRIRTTTKGVVNLKDTQFLATIWRTQHQLAVLGHGTTIIQSDSLTTWLRISESTGPITIVMRTITLPLVLEALGRPTPTGITDGWSDETTAVCWRDCQQSTGLWTIIFMIQLHLTSNILCLGKRITTFSQFTLKTMGFSHTATTPTVLPSATAWKFELCRLEVSECWLLTCSCTRFWVRTHSRYHTSLTSVLAGRTVSTFKTQIP
jgi:hypothetical protein